MPAQIMGLYILKHHNNTSRVIDKIFIHSAASSVPHGWGQSVVLSSPLVSDYQTLFYFIVLFIQFYLFFGNVLFHDRIVNAS